MSQYSNVRTNSLLGSKLFTTSQLIKSDPPILTNEKKKFLFGISMKGTHSGNILFSRYKAIGMPDKFNMKGKTIVSYQEDVYTYPVYDASKSVHWHVNFADEYLFGYYGGGLFAQDELQVAEHPALGSLREVLSHEGEKGLKPRCLDGSNPSPCLVSGVERRVEMSLDANKKEGRPDGLYGNVFRTLSNEVIAKATRVLDPPTISNFIAMEAPKGYGRYTRSTINFILSTAYTSFLAARLESYYAHKNDNMSVVIHTGNWGTGAYGGDKTLMALLQIAAAKMAGVDVLVYHTFAPQFTEAFNTASSLLKDYDEVNTTKFLDDIENLRFKWGESDGN